MQYLDTLIDLMIVAPGVNSIYDKAEYLFIGPDSSTTKLMDKSARYTVDKGYLHHRALTSGNSEQFGGIPHDTYGFAARSIRQFVEGL